MARAPERSDAVQVTTLFEGRPATHLLPLDPDFADARRPREQRVEDLVGLLRTHAPGVVRAARRAAREGGSLLLELEDPRLFDVPWESAFDRLLGDLHFSSSVRVAPSVAPKRPVLPPVNVLWADAESPARRRAFSSKPPGALDLYEPETARLLQSGSLAKWADQGFEVVHVAHADATKSGGYGVLRLGRSREALSPAKMRRAFGAKTPHLLVLEGIPDSMDGLASFAHHYARTTGSTVLAVESANQEESRQLSRRLYQGIANDEPLDEIVGGLELAGEPPVLVSPPGGEEALRLEPSRGTLTSRLRELQQETGRRIDRVAKIADTAKKSGAKGVFRRRLSDFANQLGQAAARLDIETMLVRRGAALGPVREAAEAASEVSKVVVRAGAVTERVVNTWFRQGRKTIQPVEDLECSRRYALRVQIGAPSEKSNHRAPRTLPERDLERFMTRQGVALRGVVQSRHFKVLEPEKTLWLPPRPMESEPEDFAIEAPGEPRLGELLLLVYFEQNLLQVIRVWAGVGKVGSRSEPRGNWAETEFALDELSQDIQKLPSRDAQLYASVGTNPTHTLSVRETGRQEMFELSGSALSKALKQSRVRLLQLARERYEEKTPRSKEAFLHDLRRLAQTGRAFFEALVPKPEREPLAASIAGHRTLQIAHSTSLDQIYPWAVVYDHPLNVEEPSLCPEAERVLGRRGAKLGDLKALECLAEGCRHRGERSTICPSGFWGFRHTIEMPLTLKLRSDAGGLRGGATRTVPAGRQVRLCMGAWRDFSRLPKHQKELASLTRLRVAGPEFEKKTLSRALRNRHFHILYFYCHGVANPAVAATVLRLGWEGHDSFVYATDMPDFVEWQEVPPLVFINGCHTLDTEPDDLVSFNKSLSEGGAAAVIGTEIQVPEALAAPAAEELFGRLLEREELGESLRDFRLGLLLDSNVLGLAYTAYGFSDLKIV